MKGTFEGCVILLDEPGLHLHPEAQKDLLNRLEYYAKGNTLLYTTHLAIYDRLEPSRPNPRAEGNKITASLLQEISLKGHRKQDLCFKQR